MGYTTKHSLTALNVRDEEQFNEITEEMKKRDLIGYAFVHGCYAGHEAFFDPYDFVKWYNHRSDMIAIAEKFPNVYFELEGWGEDHGDFWREYYHDMESESCYGEVVFERPRKIQWDKAMVF